jgi:CDP-glycerol glycerophosphotransferase (TagB/SpsB family)
LKIPSVSFIDHWVNFKVRFVINDKTIFPDRVWVLDEKARQAAIAEGLPAEKLVIRENPQNRYLAKYWRAEFLGHSYLHQLGIDTTPETKVVLYAPDPVSLRYQKNEMGFDEVSALKLLMEALSEIAENYTLLLIIKPHPLQREDKLQDMINHLPGNKVRCEIIKKAKNAELINCADVVVGFYSNFLLEAQQLNKPVIRYFPGPQSIDPLGHLRGKLPVVHGNSPFSSLHTYLKHE